MTDPSSPPLASNPRKVLTDEIMKIGAEGFERGYSAAVEQLAEPITAQWLAGGSGLPEDRCRALLTELRQLLIQAAVPRG